MTMNQDNSRTIHGHPKGYSGECVACVWQERQKFMQEAMNYKSRLERTDCRNAGPFYELSGSHCNPDKPCDRCQWEREERRLRSALEACLERLRLVGDDSESVWFIESCQPVIAKAEAALYND